MPQLKNNRKAAMQVPEYAICAMRGLQINSPAVSDGENYTQPAARLCKK